jgi:sugar (pentulose or hexulose) kinase
MAARKHLLTIDNGTQSVRALLYDLQGNLIARVMIPLEPYFSVKPGWAEQNVEYLWEKLCEATQTLWRQSGVSRESVAGVAVTTQRACIVNLDRRGKPLRPMISWLDQRRAKGVEPVSGIWGMAFKVAGLAGVVRYLQAESEANWIAAHQPEIWARTHKCLLLSGYHTYRLTGEYRDSTAAQVGYIPFDYKRLKWAGSSSWRWRINAIEKEMLPELVAPSHRLGKVTSGAAEQTGIPEGLPVIAAGTDKGCEILGAGCIDPHVACLSYGTTATINTFSKKYMEVVRLLPAYPAPIPGGYNTEVMIYRGYWMVNWFKKQFALLERQIAESEGIEPEQLFDDLVNEVPPGSMGLILQPYWSPGLTMPEAKGAIIGFGDVHTRAHLYRAILEGLAYGLREGRDRIEKRSGIPITRLLVAGGGSQSDAAMQLTADIFGLPAERPHVYEASGLGAAIDAAVGLKLHSDFRTAVAAMTRTARVFEPDPANREIYDGLYNRIYLRMYKRLQPFYKDIQKITGYPRKA